jgi:hypothetical protein
MAGENAACSRSMQPEVIVETASYLIDFEHPDAQLIPDIGVGDPSIKDL